MWMFAKKKKFCKVHILKKTAVQLFLLIFCKDVELVELLM